MPSSNKDQVVLSEALSELGVRTKITNTGVQYILPFISRSGWKYSGWPALLIGAIPCFACALAPDLLSHWIPKIDFSADFFLIFFYWFWVITSSFFGLLFMTVSLITFRIGGRAWIWIDGTLVRSTSFFGGEMSSVRVSFQAVDNIAVELIPDSLVTHSKPAARIVLSGPEIEDQHIAEGYPEELLSLLAQTISDAVESARG